MKLAVMALLAAGLIAAGEPGARSVSLEWPRFAQPSLQQVIFVSSDVPAQARADKEIELTLVFGLPYGCYRPDIDIEHRDAFTHVIRPVLLEDQAKCLRPSSIDIQRISLGYLSEGVHTLLFDNVQQAASPATFWVEGDSYEKTNEPIQVGADL
jgi:hypothetical protein